MANNKYDFIKELLANKKLSQEKRERILDLASKEFSIEGTLEERISKLEKLVINSEKSDLSESSTIDPNNIEKDKAVENGANPKFPTFYFNPVKSYQFLKELYEDPILSTIHHPVDINTMTKLITELDCDEYDFEKHYKLILRSFNTLIKKHSDHKNRSQVDYKLIGLLKGYLTGKNKNDENTNWGDGVTVHWGMKQLKSWSKENPGIPPNIDVDLSPKLSNNGFECFDPITPRLKLVHIEGILISQLQNFNHIVSHFKYLWQLRSDNNLKDILENNILPKWKDKFIIDIDQIDNYIKHFVNIQRLIQYVEALMKLIEEVKSKNGLDKPEIEIKFYKDNKDIIFSIRHKNSMYQNKIDDIHLIGKGYENLINNQINGMGEFDVRAVFPDNKSYQIKFWDFEVRSKNKPYYWPIESVQGVEYILKLKKV